MNAEPSGHDQPESLLQKADEFFNRGRYEAAMAQYRKVLEIESDNEQAKGRCTEIADRKARLVDEDNSGMGLPRLCALWTA